MIAVVASLVAATGAQAQTIELRREPEGAPTTAVPLVVSQGSTEGFAQVYLNADKDVQNVTLTARVGSHQASFTPAGGTAGAQFTIPTKPKAAQVDITVSDPAASDTGKLYALIDGRYTLLADLTVKREASSGLTVEGAAGDTKTLAVATDTLDQPLTIVNDTNRRIDGLRLRIGDLAEPRGGGRIPLTATAGGQPVTEDKTYAVDAHDQLVVQLHATPLDIAGDYTGSMRLIYGTTSTAIAIKVTRNREAATVMITNPDPVQVDTLSPSGNANVTFRVKLHETSGRDCTLGPPVVTVSRKDGNGAVSVNPTLITVRPETGASSAQNLEPITVPGGGDAIAVVHVEGLDGPGQFTITVTWPGVTEEKVATAVASLRVSWVWALGVLVGAILAAIGIRLLWNDLRPKLQSRRLIAHANNRFEVLLAAYPPASPDQQEVINAIRARVRAAWDGDAGAETGSALANDILGKLDILGRWLRAWIALVALDKRPEGAADKLKSVGLDYLATKTGDATAAAATLRAAEELIARTPEVRAAIDALDTAFIEWRSGPRPAELPETAKTVEAKLMEARTSLAEGKLPEAEAAYKAAFAAFTEAAADELASLSAEDARPAYVPAEAWANLGEQLQPLIAEARAAVEDAARATAAYHLGYSAYLGVLINGLRQALAHKAGSEEQRAEVTKELDAATAAREANMLGAAAAHTRDAATKFVELPDHEAAALRHDQVEQPPPIGQAARLATARLTTPPPVTTGPVLPTDVDAWLGISVVAISVAAYAVAAVLTAILGLTLLWQDNTTWGDTSNWFAAILWGFGLQTGANAVADVPGNLKKIGGTD